MKELSEGLKKFCKYLEKEHKVKDAEKKLLDKNVQKKIKDLLKVKDN